MNTPGDQEQQLLEHKAILDNAGVAIVFTRNRQVYRCNPYAEALFGWSPGTLVGQPGSVFYPDSESYAALHAEARPILGAGKTLDTELTMARCDGSTFIAHLSARAINPDAPRAGTIWIVRDVTPEVQAREAMSRLLREQQLIFDNALIGISYQRDRKILRCNRRFEEIFGQPPGALIGQSTRVLFASDSDWEEAGRRYLVDNTAHDFDGELLYCKRDGTPIWVHIAGRPIDHTAERKIGYPDYRVDAARLQD